MADNEYFGNDGYMPFQPRVNEEPVETPAYEEPVAEPVQEETTVDETTVETMDESLDKPKRSRRSGDRHRSPRNRSRSNRSRSKGIDTASVKRIRGLIEKVDHADDRTRALVKFMLNDNSSDNDALIAALMSNDAASKVSKAVDEEVKLLDCNDLKAGVLLGAENKATRRYHWDLAAVAGPEEAKILGNGSVEMPGGDVADEAVNIRELQHNITDYRDVLLAAKDFVQ